MNPGFPRWNLVNANPFPWNAYVPSGFESGTLRWNPVKANPFPWITYVPIISSSFFRIKIQFRVILEEELSGSFPLKCQTTGDRNHDPVTDDPVVNIFAHLT